MRIVFMGTPDFAVPVLEEIIKAGHQVGYVITQPDKARNRGKKVQFTPVKGAALRHDIPVLQPEKIKNSPQTMDVLREYEPDIIVVVAYGQIIQKELLSLPRFGCVNVHASLLPRLRGASPIQHAILCGEEETGVTIMQMGEGLDTGDMLSRIKTPVGSKNGEQLHDELSVLGAKLLAETLPKIEAGKIQPEKQDDSLSTYAGLITKQDGKVDFTQSPEVIERKIRAFDPWPGAFCTFREDSMKIWKAVVQEMATEKESGTIIAVSDDGLDVACGGGVLRITEIQMPGKKRVSINAFLRGNQIEKEEKLG
ncbi:MAG: methionyl-tRNA formyltransferase [Emergencia sp.]|nr:methionyl-tRNA formyltransferase [Emergencia sp.]